MFMEVGRTYARIFGSHIDEDVMAQRFITCMSTHPNKTFADKALDWRIENKIAGVEISKIKDRYAVIEDEIRRDGGDTSPDTATGLLAGARIGQRSGKARDGQQQGTSRDCWHKEKCRRKNCQFDHPTGWDPAKAAADHSNQLRNRAGGGATCWGCGKKGHLKRDCPEAEDTGDRANNRAAVDHPNADAGGGVAAPPGGAAPISPQRTGEEKSAR